MDTSFVQSVRNDIQALVTAIAHNDSRDAPNLKLTAQQWELLASYMQPGSVGPGQFLIRQGTEDRTVYFVEEGSLSVHYEDSKGQLRLAIVGAGSVVGEGAFFHHQPRSANVQASSPAKVWGLAAIRFTEMANRQPQLALMVAMALGSVVAKRLAYRPKRIAVT